MVRTRDCAGKTVANIAACVKGVSEERTRADRGGQMLPVGFSSSDALVNKIDEAIAELAKIASTD